MKITHHLDESTLLSFAAGALSPAMAVVVSAHISMCPTCRRELGKAEALGGSLLDNVERAPMSQGSINNVLELLEADSRTKTERARDDVAQYEAHDHDGIMPASVAALVGMPLSEIKWKRTGRGIGTHQIDLGEECDGKLFLMRIRAGQAVPEHGHGGNELTLVLSGAYNDECGRFGHGDVADLDEEIEHQPVVEAGEDCICLVAVERPTRFKGVIPRMLQPLVGI